MDSYDKRRPISRNVDDCREFRPCGNAKNRSNSANDAAGAAFYALQILNEPALPPPAQCAPRHQKTLIRTLLARLEPVTEQEMIQRHFSRALHNDKQEKCCPGAVRWPGIWVDK
jgi:hypothetical protein